MKNSLLTTLQPLLFFLLLSLSDLATCQQLDTRNDHYTYNGNLSPAVAIVVMIVIVALFFMGFFTVFIRHCTNALNANVDNRIGGVRRVANSTAARGIDASVIEKFPIFVYSEVKMMKIGKSVLECAICLNEFEDDETLRLLPQCDHVFHPNCIDAWLKGHVTCPVCRMNLVEEEKQVQPELEITETDLESQIPEPVMDTRVKLSRSHTTGHSVIVTGENIDRFTLRLPEDLRKKIMSNWKMNRSSNSLLVLPRSYKSVQSDRWLFRKTQSFMWRNQDNDSIKDNAVISTTGDLVRANRWDFLRNPSFLWRTTPVPSPRVGVNKDGEGTSSIQHTGTIGLASGSFRLPV